MRRIIIGLAVIAVVVANGADARQVRSAIVADVRAAVAAKDFPRGEMLVEAYRSTSGVTPELIEALSWLARGAYAAGDLDQAVQYSVDTYDLAVAALETRRLETDAHLETALGAAIETDALVRAARGDRSSAVYFLEREIEKYRNSPIHKRLQKNLNLLTLEGQVAPPLDTREHVGPAVPRLGDLKGNVVLLFFWAHWCPDCKRQAPIDQRRRRFRPTASGILGGYTRLDPLTVPPTAARAVWLFSSKRGRCESQQRPRAHRSLPLVGLRVIDRKLTHGRIRLPEQRRLLRRALDIPVIHRHSLDQPHGGSAVAAGAVNERRLSASGRNGT
jgi:hypothetical protein